MARLDEFSTRTETALRPIADSVSHLWLGLLSTSTRTRDGVFLFTGVNPGDGGTTITAATGLGLATHLEEPILVIESDLPNPGLAKLLQLETEVGLGDVLSAQASLTQAITKTDVPFLDCLPAGESRRTRLGGAQKLESIVTTVKANYRYVLIDSGPLIHYPAGNLMLKYADEAIIVARARDSKKPDLEKLAQMIEGAQTPVLGSVLNHYRREAPAWIQGE